METNNLRALVRTKLLARTSRVYYGVAPSSAEYPYTVFELKELSFDDGLSLQELEVGLVDYGTDKEPIENLADGIQADLDHFQDLTDDFEISIYKERRQPLYEDDKQIIRRRLTFQVRLYWRS